MKGQSKNGHRRSNSRFANDDKRLVYLTSKAMGKKCIATITDGSRYQGLLVGSDLSPLSVVLLKPQLVGSSLLNEKNNLDKLPENLIIQAKDLIDLEVDVDLSEPVKPPHEFKTDADISGKMQIKERELERWVPDDEVELTLEDDGSEWDQFKVNQEKFGVESSYDEHLYTTRIDTSAPDYHERVAKAERIAKEIEQQATTDRHILEERGVVVDDSGVDEEDKYSGVDRRGDELMAALRNASISKPAQQGTTTHHHHDPAIVSSSKQAKPESIPPKPPVPNESFRLNAQSEINSLREFSANFKIPHKMPQDLLPILAKDKMKQDEILKKQQDHTKKEPKTYKLNPKAAVFTPSSKHATISSPKKSPRPYSNGNVKKHYQISAADFFGVNKVPTKDGQTTKIKEFKCGFNMFVTTRRKHKEYEKSFQTPPTWESTVDVAHDKLFTARPVVAPVAAPIYANKFPMSSQAAAMMQQQQQQQFAMMFPPQMPVFYGDPTFYPPQGFVPPPQFGNPMMMGNPYGRRYTKKH